MADLNARIKPKKSSTTGEVPQAADLEVAEIAVNTADGKLFVKHTDDSIKEISSGTDITTESIDALNDVDTSTTTPTDGQVLTWVNANSQWEPADAPADAVASVNGQTGAVSLGANDLNDVAYPVTPATATWTGRWEVHTLVDDQCSPLGKVGPSTGLGGGVNLSFEDADGQNMTNNIGFNNLNLYYKLNNGSWTAVSNGSVQSTCSPITFVTGSTVLRTVILGSQVGDNLYLSDGLPATTSPPTDGQVLTWVNANSQWEPAGLQGTAIRAALGIGEYVDDAAAGTGGVTSGALYYNTTSSDYRLKT